MRTSTGAVVDLLPIAAEICRRYHAEFTDDAERYGNAGESWCRHDNQYLLAWAIQDARDGTVDLVEQALWLADVLGRRGFPVPRLVRNLELAADVIGDALVAGDLAAAAALRLTTAAAAVYATV